MPVTTTQEPIYPEPPRTCDSLFATVCAVPERGLAAALRWARSSGYSHPLMLLGWSLGQLSPSLWRDLETAFTSDQIAIRCRYGGGPHVWVEGAALAHQAESVLKIDSHPMPEHVVAADFWDTLVLSATFQIRSGAVRICRQAYEQTLEQPFAALTYRGGERGDDPTIPAFLYGVVLALDPQAARPPIPIKIPSKAGSSQDRR